jgi:hypothetical protein
MHKHTILNFTELVLTFRLEMSKYVGGGVSGHALTIQFTGFRKEAQRLIQEYSTTGACVPPGRTIHFHFVIHKHMSISPEFAAT